MLNRSGTSIIQKALGQFDSIKRKLAEGIEKCRQAIASNDEVVTALQQENVKLLESVEAAEKATRGIEKLLNGE